jgi:hypothetical protein
MSRVKDLRLERRSGLDRRRLYDIYYLSSEGAEERPREERRAKSERRAGWKRVSRWGSVPTENSSLKMS